MTIDLEFETKPRVRNMVRSFSIKKMVLNEGDYKDTPFFIASFETDDTVFEYVMLSEEVKRVEETCRKITDGMDIDTDNLPPMEEKGPVREFFPDIH